LKNTGPLTLSFAIPLVCILLLGISLLAGAGADPAPFERLQDGLEYFKISKLKQSITSLKTYGQERKLVNGVHEWKFHLLVKTKKETFTLKNCMATDATKCGRFQLTCLGGDGHFNETIKNWSLDGSTTLTYIYDKSKSKSCFEKPKSIVKSGV